MTPDTATDRAAALFSTLSHPGRLGVLVALENSAPRSSGELQELLGIERTSLSHQLRVLKEAQLVTVEVQGRRRLYSLADHHVAHIVRDAIAHVQEPRR